MSPRTSQIFPPSPLAPTADPTAAFAHLQNLAPSRRGLLLAPLFAALPAGLLAGSASPLGPRARPDPDASHRARRICVEERLGRRAAAFDRDCERVRLYRPTGPVCGAGALVSGLHERAARLRHRPAVLRSLRHVVG